MWVARVHVSGRRYAQVMFIFEIATLPTRQNPKQRMLARGEGGPEIGHARANLSGALARLRLDAPALLTSSPPSRTEIPILTNGVSCFTDGCTRGSDPRMSYTVSTG